MNSISLRAEPVLVQLRKKAEQYAAGRRERPSSVHLLAAIAEDGSPAARLLHERRLTSEQLLRAARSSSDDAESPLSAVIDEAREFATRMRSQDPNPLHVLVALLSLKRSAAYRVLDQFGIDVPRLRLAAMNLGLGHPSASPEPAPTPALSSEAAAAPKRSRAVSVPLMTRGAGSSRRVGARGRALAVAPRQANAGNRPTEAGPTAVHPREKVARPALDARPATENAGLKSGLKPAVARSLKPATSKVPLRPSTRGGETAATAPAQTAALKTPLEQNYALDKEKFPLLAALGRNLSELAARGELPVVVGREIEVERVLDVLAKQGNNSPCLVGNAGVGKSSVILALASRTLRITEPAQKSERAVDDRIVLEIPVSELLAGTGVRGSLAVRFTELQKELLAARGRVVLVLEDLPLLFSGDAAGELCTPLRRGLANGDFCCIGTATSEEYQRVIESDPSLERRLVRVDVEEPDLDVAVAIVAQRALALEQHHEVTYNEQSLRAAVAWSARYIAGRAMPDKAIAVVDLAGARARRRGLVRVGREQVAEVIAETADVPLSRLLEADGEHLLRLELVLAERVVGHTQALGRIAQVIRRSAAGFDNARPLGTILLLGPSGVGKTETAKALADVLFGTEKALTRFDLSEFSEAHSVARLIGAPPGYVGHEAGGQLTEAIRRRPYQVILLDEIEKAHVDVLQALLPLLDEGRFTDARGRVFDFTNTLLVLTSNLGSAEVSGSSDRVLGFGDRTSSTNSYKERVLSSAKKALPPEFWNRIDETLVYDPLSRPELEEVARRLLQSLADRVAEQRGVEMQIDANVVDLLLASGGFDPAHGARPMRRAVARLVEAPLSELLLAGNLGEGSSITLEARDGHVHFQKLTPLQRLTEAGP